MADWKIRIVWRTGALAAGLLVMFFLLSLLVQYVPVRNIPANLGKSYETLSQEGYYPYAVPGVPLTKLDNFTDAWMLQQCYPDTTVAPLDNVFRSTNYYTLRASGTPRIETLRAISEGDLGDSDVENYGRYWHGYLLTLRSLLSVTDYRHIRLINFIVLGFLAVAACAVTYRRRPRICGHALVITLLAAPILIIPLSLQYSSCFYILLASLTLLLSCPRLSSTTEAGFLSFFAIGAVTSYLDLLTAPLLTLCIPAAIVLYGTAGATRRTVWWTAGWFLGYGLLWMSKWLLSPLLTDFSIIGDAMSQIALRTGGSLEEYTGSPLRNSYLIAGLLLLWIAVQYIRGRRRGCARYLLLLQALPVVWLVVLHNHSTLHFSFVWRVTLATLLTSILYAGSGRKL